MIRTQVVKLYPNQIMRKHLDELCDYRRYCWNQGLETWNNMYDESLIMNNKKLKPNEYKVRNELVNNKQDWQYQLSSRCLQLAIKDLGIAWKNFFDKARPDWGKPKFKTKKVPRQGFKTDRAKIVNGKLKLDKPRGIQDWHDIKFSGAKSIEGNLKVVSIFKENNKYYASLPFEVKIKVKYKTKHKTAVDVNVGHFNYTEGVINVLPKKLQRLYKRIAYYQKLLAYKRKVNGILAYSTHNYVNTSAK